MLPRRSCRAFSGVSPVLRERSSGTRPTKNIMASSVCKSRDIKTIVPVSLWPLLCVIGLALGQGPAAAQVSLVPQASVWKYLDGGTNPPANWKDLNFDDSTWA